MRTRQTASFTQQTINPAAGSKFGYIFYQATANLLIYSTRLNLTSLCTTAPTAAETEIIQVVLFPFPAGQLNQVVSTPNLLDSNFESTPQVSSNNTITFSVAAANAAYTVFNEIYEEWEQGTSLAVLPNPTLYAQDAVFRETPFYLPTSQAVCVFVETVTTTGKITFTFTAFLDYELAEGTTGRSI